MIDRIVVRRLGSRWCVVLPQFGFAAPAPVWFGSHAEALGFAVAEADRRGQPVSLYATAGVEVWSPWTLRAVRR